MRRDGFISRLQTFQGQTSISLLFGNVKHLDLQRALYYSERQWGNRKESSSSALRHSNKDVLVKRKYVMGNNNSCWKLLRWKQLGIRELRKKGVTSWRDGTGRDRFSWWRDVTPAFEATSSPHWTLDTVVLVSHRSQFGSTTKQVESRRNPRSTTNNVY